MHEVVPWFPMRHFRWKTSNDFVAHARNPESSLKWYKILFCYEVAFKKKKAILITSLVRTTPLSSLFGGVVLIVIGIIFRVEIISIRIRSEESGQVFRDNVDSFPPISWGRWNFYKIFTTPTIRILIILCTWVFFRKSIGSNSIKFGHHEFVQLLLN